MSLQKQRLDLFSETLRLAFVQQGAGRAFLLLPWRSRAWLDDGPCRRVGRRELTVLPTHPGFDGEPWPERFARIDDLGLADSHGVTDTLQ